MVDPIVDPAPNPNPNPAPAPSPAPTPAPAPNPAPGDPAPTPSPAPAADWGQLKTVLAGGDEAKLNVLNRYASLEAYNAAHFALRQRLSSGELKAVTPYPEKGTPEAQTAWRVEQGIPDVPEKYEVKLADGLKIEEADKPFLDSMLKAAHAANVPPSAVNALSSWFFNEKRATAEKAAEQTKELQKMTEDALRAEWSNDYRGHINKIEGVLDANLPAGSELKPLIIKAIATNPDFARLWAGISLQLNPGSTLVPGDHSTQAKSIAEEKAVIEKRMREDRSGYNKDEKQQQRYRDLIDAETRLQKQG